MGSNSGLDDDAAPEHKVFVDAFWIDKYEVTNGQYSKCVDAKKCSRIEIITKAHYDDSPNFGSPQFDSYPVIYSFWDDADSYCKWAGKRLPTEAEWEKAARGTDARIYPWGNAFDGTKLNSSIVADAYTTTAPVGSFPSGVSPYGVYDMAGNVWEYVADWYAKDYYKSSPAINPKGPPTSAEHVVRGGSWDSGKTDIYTVTRTFFWPPEARFGDLGFRCAQNP